MSRQIESLITMVNQIADNAPKQETPEDTAQAVAGHLQKFWAKPMKKATWEHLKAGGDGLNLVSVQAVWRL